MFARFCARVVCLIGVCLIVCRLSGCDCVVVCLFVGVLDWSFACSLVGLFVVVCVGLSWLICHVFVGWLVERVFVRLCIVCVFTFAPLRVCLLDLF